jgi:hypothetical protein
VSYVLCVCVVHWCVVAVAANAGYQNASKGSRWVSTGAGVEVMRVGERVEGSDWEGEWKGGIGCATWHDDMSHSWLLS